MTMKISFKTPKRQAAKAARLLFELGEIRSLGSTRNVTVGSTGLATFAKERRLGDLDKLTRANMIDYLETRSMEVRQKTLNLDRKACQHLLGGEKLPVIKSEIETVLKSRSYSSAQIERIAAAQTPKYAFSTRLSYRAGLRAQELGRIRLLADQPADDRPWHKDLYLGREGVRYSVRGKGGLYREIRLSFADAARLETLRLPVPRTLYDRGIEIVQYYDIGFGQKWSNSFTKAAIRALN